MARLFPPSLGLGASTVLGLVLIAGCATDKSEDDGGESAADDGTDGSDGTDGTDGSDGEAPPAHVLDGLPTAHWAVPNLDDDDEDGDQDFGRDFEDNELVGVFADSPFETLDEGQVLVIELEATSEGPFALWVEGEQVWDSGDGGTISLDSSVPLEDVRFEVGDFAVSAELTMTLTGADGAELASQVHTLNGAPLILNHHLQQAIAGGAVSFEYRGWGDNLDMLDDMVDVIGDSFLTPDAGAYDYDVWVQDELEFGTSSVPGHSIQVTVDSIRMGRGGLDDYPEDFFFGPDQAVGTWGSGRATSQDSFGNLEISPPVTVDGVEYPFGRIYWGDSGRGLAPADGLQDFLERQAVQAPFELDIGWLCVGHVDEFTTFLPDPTAPRGFRLYVADIDEGRAFLEGLDPDMSLPQYRYDHGFADVGEMLEDSSLWSYNEDLQLDSIDPNIEILTEELGLTPDEIVRVPALFERSRDCYGYALALIPATVNMAVWTDANGVDADLFMPDPFFRSNTSDPSSDPFIATFAALLPPHLRAHWVDDWDVYHMGWGEVHCGTNVRRDQPLDWWSAAPHLVENAP